VSETTSVTSSLFNYQYENGRRYHAYRAGQYLLPNDEKEQDRLDMTHHLFQLTLDGALTHTKLENPQEILDIGTGTGIWVSGKAQNFFSRLTRSLIYDDTETQAMEMGDMFPNAQVIGTDLSPIQSAWLVVSPTSPPCPIVCKPGTPEANPPPLLFLTGYRQTSSSR